MLGGASALVVRDTISLSLFVKTRAAARAHVVASVSSVAIGLGLGLALIASAGAADTPSPDAAKSLESVPPALGAAVAVQQESAAAAAASAPSVNTPDLDCLTAAVYYEARGEAPAGQAAVAQVVLNRVGQPRFAPSVCGVVYQGAHGRSCQFSFACHGGPRGHREAAAWSRARSVATRALSGYVMSEVGHATYFHVASMGAVWGPQMARVARVGRHIFYSPGAGHGDMASAYRMLEAASKSTAQPPEALHGPELPTPPAPAAIQNTAASAPSVPAKAPTAS